MAHTGRGTYRAWHIHGGKVSLTYESSCGLGSLCHFIQIYGTHSSALDAFLFQAALFAVQTLFETDYAPRPIFVSYFDVNIGFIYLIYLVRFI